MEGYDIAQICKNGHVITTTARTAPEFKKDFCKSCGEVTITECPNCQRFIKGSYHIPGVIGIFDYITPRFCDSCGSAFPWIQSKIDTAINLVDLIDNLNNAEKADFVESIIDLIRETSKIPLAIVKINKYLLKVDSQISDGILDILLESTNKKYHPKLIKNKV